jgi:hypothetical protein
MKKRIVTCDIFEDCSSKEGKKTFQICAHIAAKCGVRTKTEIRNDGIVILHLAAPKRKIVKYYAKTLRQFYNEKSRLDSTVYGVSRIIHMIFA